MAPGSGLAHPGLDWEENCKKGCFSQLSLNNDWNIKRKLWLFLRLIFNIFFFSKSVTFFAWAHSWNLLKYTDVVPFRVCSCIPIPPRPSSVGRQPLHSRHDSWAHPAVPPGHRQRPSRQSASIRPHLRSPRHMGVGCSWGFLNALFLLL